MNSVLKTFVLLGIMSVIVITLGGFLGGRQGIYLAFGIALLMNGVSYFFSDKIALKMSGAKPLDRIQYPHIYTMIEELAQHMQLPMPKLYITPDPQANAFATGRNPQHASVAVTAGILSALSPDQLKGVLAHELAHVKNRDVLIATVAAVLASTISFVANMSLFGGHGDDDEDSQSSGTLAIVAAILVPIAASLIQMAISRQREFGADHTGAKTIGHGKSLADALLIIHDSAKRHPMHINPALSSLYIGDPFGGGRGLGSKLLRMLSTHPPVQERIKRLQQL